MKKMLDCLTWLLWISEIVFLAASTPHIATYFEHFDNPTDIWSTAYSWAVGYGLALTIDGVSFVVLMSLVVAIKYKRPWWLTSFLVFALLLISSLSWFINWQYDVVFRSSTFASADSIQVHAWAMNTSIGNLNPLIGGAFPLLSVLYALVAKALEVDESSLTKKAMTPEEFANERLRIQQQSQLKSLKASQWDGKGLISSAKERLIGVQSQANEMPMTEDQIVNDEEVTENPIDSVVESEGLGSSSSVPLDRACQDLGLQERTVKQLLSKGMLKSPGGSKRFVTRSSIDAYLASKKRKRRQSPANETPVTEDQIANGNGNGHQLERDTDPLNLPIVTV